MRRKVINSRENYVIGLFPFLPRGGTLAKALVIGIILTSLTTGCLFEKEKEKDTITILPINIDFKIDENDSKFYSSYPSAPIEIGEKEGFSDTFIGHETKAIWGEDLPFFFIGENWEDYIVADFVLQTPQLTNTTKELAKIFKERNPNDRVMQAKEVYYFVASHIDYKMDNEYEYPVTILRTGKGQCSEYSTLLTSIYLELNFDVALVFTYYDIDRDDRIEALHIYNAIYLPEYEIEDSDQELIKEKLGNGWVGLDATNVKKRGDEITSIDDNYFFDFGYLDGKNQGHYNIFSIAKPMLNATIYSLDVKWSAFDWERGYYVKMNVKLFAWKNTTIVFTMYDEGKVFDRKIYELNENEWKEFTVELDYASAWTGSSDQYITMKF
ncbi:MAG: transglutaminase-like domain-containing protein [Candidatus Thermoplasmatota archaeon]